MAENLEIFENLLLLAVENGASDIHIKTDRPAYLRLQGALEPVDMDKLTNPQINDFIEKTCPGQFFERWRADNQVDYSYRLEDVGRFRVSAFYQRGTPSIVFRHVKDQPPTFEQLNHEPAVLNKLCRQKDGIALICGATGSGKSSTLPAMLNWINHNYEKHIVTLEDPIEFTYKDIKAVINQREVGIDVPDFTLGMRAVLRQDPDIMLVGEMRDSETFSTALSAAETGHYVLGTLHSSNAQQAVQRLFEFYPVEQHPGLRRQVASSLRAAITQRLVPALEGQGRLPVLEIFVVDGIGRTAIGEGTFEKIPSIIEASMDTGSKSFNQDLYRLVKAGLVSKKVALDFSPNPKALEMNLKGIFLSAGGIVS